MDSYAEDNNPVKGALENNPNIDQTFLQSHPFNNISAALGKVKQNDTLLRRN